MSTDQGKKIDEIKIDWETKMIVRYHADDQSFSVEAGDERFKGEVLKPLIEQGKVYLMGWSKLTWEPIISISTDVYSDMSFSYQRCFRSKHKGRVVYRAWKVNGENECQFGSYVRSDGTTGDILEGEPGAVMDRIRGERTLPFTPERWSQVRNLSKIMKEALDKATKKLSELLRQEDLDAFLLEAGSRAPRLTFDEASAKE